MRLDRIIGLLIILITLLVVGSAHGVQAVPPGQDAVWNITYPTEGSVISGEVEITGTATHPNFAAYGVLYGAGARPAANTEWIFVTSARVPNMVVNGTLTTWDTTTVPNGQYTLALAVYEVGNESPHLHFVNNITVQNEEATPTPTATPEPTTDPNGAPETTPEAGAPIIAPTVEQPPTATPRATATLGAAGAEAEEPVDGEAGALGLENFSFDAIGDAFWSGVSIAVLLYVFGGLYVAGRAALRYYLKQQRTQKPQS
ncbi:MAG: hypothetical protein ACLFU8_01940 [Anaerolineales bacterium]